MRLVPKGMARYAVLIVLLLMIAALAAREVIEHITDLVNEARQGRSVTDEMLNEIVAWPILALSGGFLFLAGALGIWMIRSVAVREARARVGRFVEAMDYLKDGVLVLDQHARIVGMNPAAEGFAVQSSSRALLEAYPYLKEADKKTLLDPLSPQEVEAVAVVGKGLRALRFRSQPHEDMTLVLVSDITGVKAAEVRARQAARLQLVGRIANGVAHDFSNILSSISGFASILKRQNAIAPAGQEAFGALLKEADRGSAVANRLLYICRTPTGGQACQQLKERILEAIEVLRAALPPDWRIVADIKGPFDPTALSDAQVEQLIVTAGMAAADEQGVPGLLHIRVRSPQSDTGLASHAAAAAIVLIGAFGSDETFHGDEAAATTEVLMTDDVGVVQSVIRALLEEVGGRFDPLKTATGKHMYRMVWPHAVGPAAAMEAWVSIPEDVRARIAGWRVLMGFARRDDALRPARLFEDMGLNVELASDIVALLQHIEADRGLKGIVVERTLLGEEADALLRAIRKLRPRTGIVVLDTRTQFPPDLTTHIVFETPDIRSERMLLDTLIRAEAMAMNMVSKDGSVR